MNADGEHEKEIEVMLTSSGYVRNRRPVATAGCAEPYVDNIPGSVRSSKSASGTTVWWFRFMLQMVQLQSHTTRRRGALTLKRTACGEHRAGG